MYLIVNYLVFHPDNHQGGSGVWYKHKKHLDIESSKSLMETYEAVHVNLKVETRKMTHNWDDSKYQIQTIEMFI